MQDKIMALVQNSSSTMKTIELFGYTSRGIPGIEIVGLDSKTSKIIKEKFIYILKLKKIKIPLRKFVLSTSTPLKLKKNSSYDMNLLELPLFILLYKLLEEINIKNLSRCVCAGSLSLTGAPNIFNLSKKCINELNKRNFTVIYNNVLEDKTTPNKFINVNDIL